MIKIFICWCHLIFAGMEDQQMTQFMVSPDTSIVCIFHGTSKFFHYILWPRVGPGWLATAQNKVMLAHHMSKNLLFALRRNVRTILSQFYRYRWTTIHMYSFLKIFIYKKIIVKEYEKWIYEKLFPTTICYCCVQLPFFDDFDEDVECRFLKCNFPH